MDTPDKIGITVFTFLVIVFLCVFVSDALKDKYIAGSIDPIVTACALVKDKACLLLAGRK